MPPKRFDPGRFLVAVIGGLIACGQPAASRCAAEPPPAPLLKQLNIDDITFTLPQSLRLEKVAAAPLIQWPIAATWDDRGGLLVLECHWNGQSVEEQLTSRPHCIVRLEDRDRDGVFDQRHVIADDLGFPEGILFHEGALLVAAPPVIWRFEDTDTDGFYETRNAWFDGGTLTGCANDLHGPVLGRDGWIYWTKGAFAEQTLESRDAQAQTSRASHMYRRHPAGGGVETLMTGGMDNPVDVAFLPDGERVFCSTFFHHPRGGLRDGIAHAIYGGVFGKPNDVLKGHRRTGPLLEPIVELGPAAPAALACLGSANLAEESGLFPIATDRTPYLISAQFNLQKLGIHRLVADGASFTSESHDLLTANRVDFHPVDVLEDQDGSLIVLDTGGWYDLCCPSSGVDGQIAPGGIYRIRREASSQDLIRETAPSSSDSISWHIAQLTSPSAGSRERSIQWLVEQSDDAIPLLRQTINDPDASTSQRLESLWCLSRLLVRDPHLEVVKQTVLECLHAGEVELQRAAAHLVSLYRWPEAAPTMAEHVLQGDAALRRLAAECLGRLPGDEPSIHKSLMQSITSTVGDRALEHAIVYAMLERDQPEILRPYLADGSPREQWAALMVLSQNDRLGSADVEALVGLIEGEDDAVRTLAIDVLAADPAFASSSRAFLQRLWESDGTGSLAIAGELAGAWSHRADISDLVATWLGDDRLSEAQARMLIEVTTRLRGQAIPERWVQPLADQLSDHQSPWLWQRVEALGQVKWTLPRDQPVVDQVLAALDAADAPLTQQLDAVSVLPPGTAGVPDALQRVIIDGLVGDDDELAARSARALSRVRLTAAAASHMVEQMDQIGPLQLQVATLAALQVEDPLIDARLLEALGNIPAAKSLTGATLVAAVADRPESTRETWSELFDRLNAPPENIVEAVDQWLAKLPSGDPVRGHQVFRSSQAACSSCHQVGYVGGDLGPELTKIGKSRSRRDLVEAVLFPSARLEQSFRPWQVLTVDGRVLHGFIASETETQLELICNADTRCVIDQDEIEHRRPSDVSVMPAGLEQSLSLQQLADLISFLEASR